MPHLGPTELILILVIVIILFGVGRIGKLSAEFAKGIRVLRSSLSSGETEPADSSKDRPS